MNRWWNERRMSVAFFLPHGLGVGFFYLLPFLWGIGMSLRTASGFGIGNYAALFHNEAFRLAIYNTILLMFLTVPLLIVISMSAALYIYRFRRSGMPLLHTLVFNYAIPSASITFVWQLMFSNHGFANIILDRCFGIQSFNWLDGGLLYIPIISLFTLRYAAYPTIILFGGMQSIPVGLLEAAFIDGATRRQAFLRITFPLLAPELIFVTLLGFYFNFRLFKEAYALFGAYPPKSIYLLQHFMSNHFQKVNMDILTSSATVMAVFITILIRILLKLNNSGYLRD